MFYSFLAVLVSTVWLFVSGALVFAVWLPHWFQANFGQIARDPNESPKIGIIVLEKLLQSLGMVLLLRWTSVPVRELIAIPLLLIAGTYLFSTYSTYNVKGGPVLRIALIDAIRLVLAMLIAAWILGRVF